MARVSTSYRRGGTGYRLPGIVYRRTYDEVFSGAAALVQPRRRAVTVRIYDRQDLLVAILSTNAQRPTILALDWELLDTGCGAFTMELAADPGIQHDFRLDIHLWNDPDPIYSGLVQRLPEPGSTNRTFTFGGYGFLDMLNRMLVTETYGPQNVRAIVNDLSAKLGARQPRLVPDQTQVDYVPYSTAGSLAFLRTLAKDALKQLAELAGGYTWGVDADRKLFFKAPNQAVDMHSWVGKHLETFTPQSESDAIVTVVYVKAGKVRNDLPSDNPFYKTNWLEEPIKDDAAIALWEWREGVYSAPSVLNLVDAAVAATVWLSQNSKPRQYASVKGLVYDGERLSCVGQARIVGKGGAQFILPKKSLKFKLGPTSVDVSLELGDLDYTAAVVVSRLAAATGAENLARQNSQKQL
ncbi:MAG: hypothetical protein J0I12_11100 [Candidatus Eremiobacteraeota bacterium]|nr:hypothetical protein [Candidatus Eremiobacteraeota bacterium]